MPLSKICKKTDSVRGNEARMQANCPAFSAARDGEEYAVAVG